MPESIQSALRRLLGSHRAERLMVAGAMIDAEEASRIGMVDELVDTELVVGRAIAWLQELVKLPPEAMSETRRIARADLHAIFDHQGSDCDEKFAERWFSAEAQSVLKAMVARLKAKKA